MTQPFEEPARTRWTIQHGVFIFYGNGGRFIGSAFDRWYEALEAARGLRLYVGGAGASFGFDAAERTRGNELFKRKQLRFAVVTENIRHRILGSTARLLGVDLHLYSWEESRRPFAELERSTVIAEELHETLLRLRESVDRELVEAKTPTTRV